VPHIPLCICRGSNWRAGCVRDGLEQANPLGAMFKLLTPTTGAPIAISITSIGDNVNKSDCLCFITRNKTVQKQVADNERET
jgi:hypothetical protein